MNEMENRILNLLTNYGSMTSKQLCEYLDVPDGELRNTIRDMNLHGYAVISNTNGFKMANGPEEVQKYIDSLEVRSAGIMERVRALKDIQRKMVNMELF